MSPAASSTLTPTRAPLPRVLLGVLVCGVVWLWGCCGVVFAGVPGWLVSSEAVPSTVAPGGEVLLLVQVSNVGGASTSGAGVVVTDTLPAGMEALQAGELDSSEGVIGSSRWLCKGVAVVTCVNSPSGQPVIEPGAGFGSLGSLERPGEAPEIAIRARAGGVSGTGDNVVEVAGGGVPAPALARQPVTVSSVEPLFGLDSVSVSSYEEDGSPAVQAGGHPYGLTVDVQLNSVLRGGKHLFPVGNAKTFEVRAPAGLVGDPQAVAQCPREEFDGVKNEGQFPECPLDSQVGVATVSLGGQGEPLPGYITLPVYNLVPPAGVPAQFGFSELGIYATMDASLRTGEDYGITESVRNTAQRSLLGTTLTLWGVPASPAHDHERWAVGVPCGEVRPRSCPSGLPARPFLSNPDVCGTPMVWRFFTNEWLNPANVEASVDTLDNLAEPAMLSGCEAQNFEPSVTSTPGVSGAEEPTGLDVDLHVPQHYEDPSSPAEATVKDVTVTFPEGMTVSPSSADGLAACSEAQIGLHDAAAAACPAASEIGTVEGITPLLAQPLHGAVYLAEQEHNPFGSLLAVYMVVEGSGILVKLAGHVEANPQTGQLSTTFTEVPDQPFEDVKVDLFNGPRAPLVTPPSCGSYHTESTLSSWSGLTPAPSLSSFAITSGCASPFAPQLQAGPTSTTAGELAPFTSTISRQDGEQRLSQLQVTLPAGQLALLKSIPRCPEAAAAAGACPAASEIGETTVAAGPGPDPFWLKGHVYLTGPYQGAPLGLSILVPAIAGPFNLGNVTVRARIQINPATAQATIISDPLPQYVNNTGIPTDVRTVNVDVSNPAFTLNPTSCGPHTTTLTATSTQNTTSTTQAAYQTNGCENLHYTPKLTASSAHQASKANGASLNIKFTAHGGPGQNPEEANTASVKVTLPSQLPSRLTTIQKACLAATYAANPASCPKASDIGTWTARTPILAQPFTGPSYLVSHGGEEFPNLDVILQAEGITITLTGHINIKKGVTTVTFPSLPDAPITTVEASFPTGPYSALAANLPEKDHYNLCGHTLHMPTTLTAQNHATTTQTTNITITGCPKPHNNKTKKHPHNKKH
jgi:uncharacterized repeat protein (TIGR01451 family)